MRIGNKACFLLVFIGNETPTGVWRNIPADFLDMKGLLHQKLNPKLAKELAEMIKTGKEEDRFYGLSSKISG